MKILSNALAGVAVLLFGGAVAGTFIGIWSGNDKFGWSAFVLLVLAAIAAWAAYGFRDNLLSAARADLAASEDARRDLNYEVNSLRHSVKALEEELAALKINRSLRTKGPQDKPLSKTGW